MPPCAVLDPEKLYEVHREGMPVPRTGGVERGSLLIKFKVQYPQTLAENDLAVLRKILGNPPRVEPAANSEPCDLRVATIDPQAEARANDDEEEAPRGGQRTATCAQQ
jgi:DnaJ-class molecular chaperone